MRRGLRSSALRSGALVLALVLAWGAALAAPHARAAGSVATDAAERPASDGTIERDASLGPVQVVLRVSPASPVLGDVVRLELEVHAEPEVEVLMPEFGEALGRFEIVDFAPASRLEPDGRSVSTQVYRLQPARSGTQSIPPLRVEFVDRRPGRPPAPEGEDAYEILTERIALEIEPILPADA
ncbi:MAG TPA: hypothetical protein PLW10_21640, partial [Myxococcota bacterium]|nr:hypothetical protein [Myxococcota bacterium]